MADEPEWVPAKPKIIEDEGKVKIADKVPEEDVEEDLPFIGSSIEDPEQERNYADYKKIVKELKCQTAHLENIKNQIQIIACKTYKTFCEEKELQDLQACWDDEMEKQRCLTNKIMYLQNFGSQRRYKEINLTVTFDEDQIISAPITLEKKLITCVRQGKNEKIEKEENK